MRLASRMQPNLLSASSDVSLLPWSNQALICAHCDALDFALSLMFILVIV